MPREFEFEGATYGYVDDLDAITLDEIDLLETATGQTLQDLVRARYGGVRLKAWLSVHRGLCGCTVAGPRPGGCAFSWADSGRVPMSVHVPAEVSERAKAAAQQLAAEAAGDVVLSPSSAGPSRRTPRKRASASGPGSGAGTPRPSRGSTASARGNSAG